MSHMKYKPSWKFTNIVFLFCLQAEENRNCESSVKNKRYFNVNKTSKRSKTYACVTLQQPDLIGSLI